MPSSPSQRLLSCRAPLGDIQQVERNRLQHSGGALVVSIVGPDRTTIAMICAANHCRSPLEEKPFPACSGPVRPEVSLLPKIVRDHYLVMLSNAAHRLGRSAEVLISGLRPLRLRTGRDLPHFRRPK